MYKEIIISLIIIIAIFTMNYFTQKYTQEMMGEIAQDLTNIKERIVNNENKEEIMEDVKGTYNKWTEAHTNFAYYIEHDELEKVETDFIAFKSLFELGEYETAVSELSKTVFVLEHIEDKNSFNLENIF